MAKIHDGEPMNQGMKQIAGCKIIHHHLQCGGKKRMIYKFQSHMRYSIVMRQFCFNINHSQKRSRGVPKRYDLQGV